MSERFDLADFFVDDRMEEVALVPCGGCDMGSFDFDRLEQFATSSVTISLPSLLADGNISTRRLELAHAVIGISACEQSCAHHLLQRIRLPDFHLVVAPDSQGWTNLLQQQIDVLCTPEVETAIHGLGKVPLTGHMPLDLDATNEPPELLDFTGLICPMPIIQLSKYCRAPNNRHLELLADDRAFPADLRAWCDQKKARLLDIAQEGKVYRARVVLAPVEKPIVSEHIQISPSAPSTGDDLPFLERLDCLAMRSPLQIVELQKAMMRHRGAGTIVLVTRDPQFMEDIGHWCHQSDAALLQLEQTSGYIEAVIAIHLQRQELVATMQTVQSLDNVDGLLATSQQIPVFSVSDDGVVTTGVPFDEISTADFSDVDIQVLDYTGLRCPMPIVRLSQAIRQSRGEQFKVVADDPAFAQDLRAWCEQNHYRVISIEAKGHQIEAWIADLQRVDALPTPGAPFPIFSPEQRFHPIPTRHSLPSSDKSSNNGGYQPEANLRSGDVVGIHTGEVLQVRSPSPAHDFASSGKQVVALDQPEPGGVFVDLTTNPKLPRLSLQDGQHAAMVSRETTEFSIAQNPRAVQDLLPRSENAQPVQPDPPHVATIHLDLKGLKCPLPIVRLAGSVRENPQATFSLQADDAAFPPDLKAWCTQSKMQVLSLEKKGNVHSAMIAPLSAPAAATMPTPAIRLSPVPEQEHQSSDEFSLFEEIQSLSFWDGELPTQPVPRMAYKQTKRLDLRGLTAIDCIDKLKQMTESQDHIFHLTIEPTISMDSFQMLCELNHFSCIAINPGRAHSEVWLQRAPSG